MSKYLKIEAYSMAIMLDTNNNCLLSYSYQNEEINTLSQGILTIVNTELAVMLESYFKIKLLDYGVELYDEVFILEIA